MSQASKEVAMVLKLINDAAEVLKPAALPLDQPLPEQMKSPPPPGVIPDKVFEAIATLKAATAHLEALVLPAPEILFETSFGFHNSTALRIAINLRVADALRDGPLSIKDLASKVGSHPQFLSRQLRLLASQHIFEEVEPDVFKVNKIASCLDSGLPFVKVREVTDIDWPNASPILAMLSHTLDEVMPASVQLPTVLKESDRDPGYQACKKAHQGKSAWEAFYGPRFDRAMEGTLSMSSSLPQVYPFAELGKGPLVDVGGGAGHSSLAIAKAHPDLHIVVQDRQPVVEAAPSAWPKDLVESGRVKFQAHDFFKPQPVKEAHYFLRAILYDHNDEECVELLKAIRPSMSKDSRLILVDFHNKHPVHQPSDGRLIQAEPLLGNGGLATTAGLIDAQMASIFGGKRVGLPVGMLSPKHNLAGRERTIQELESLLKQTGFKLNRTFELLPMSLFKVAEAVPI